MNEDYAKPDWCNESTWQNAKELVFTLVPASLMSRTGQRRIEIAATALMEEAKEAWEEVDVMSNWDVVQVSGLNKSVHDYMGRFAALEEQNRVARMALESWARADTLEADAHEMAAAADPEDWEPEVPGELSKVGEYWKKANEARDASEKMRNAALAMFVENPGIPKDEVWIIQDSTVTGIMK